MSNKIGRFFQILWLSQNIWTLLKNCHLPLRSCQRPIPIFVWLKKFLFCSSAWQNWACVDQCALPLKKGLITFHFSKNMFIFKMGFGMSFHFQNFFFQNVFSCSKCERFREFFPFSEKKPNCKQKFVNKNLYSPNSFWWGCVKNKEIYIKLLNLIQLSRI